MLERSASFQPRSRSSASAGGTSGKGGQSGERLREGARLALGELDALLLRKPLEREREHFAVGVERLGLELRLELVVALEQARRLLDAEQPLELAADPCVPVDQRAVTVEGRPTRSACP